MDKIIRINLSNNISVSEPYAKGCRLHKRIIGTISTRCAVRKKNPSHSYYFVVISAHILKVH